MLALLQDIWRYVRQMLPCGAAALAVWALLYPLRKRRLARLGLYSPPWREGALALFVMFGAGLAALTLFPANLWSWVLSPQRFPDYASVGAFYPSWQQTVAGFECLPQNLVPLHDIRRSFGSYWGIFLLVGNIFMFSPVGFFPALVWDRPKWWKSTLIGFAASFTVEFTQLFIGRGTDIDDLILNTTGALAGYGMYRLLRKLCPRWITQFQCSKREEPAHG